MEVPQCSSCQSKKVVYDIPKGTFFWMCPNWLCSDLNQTPTDALAYYSHPRNENQMPCPLCKEINKNNHDMAKQRCHNCIAKALRHNYN